MKPPTGLEARELATMALQRVEHEGAYLNLVMRGLLRRRQHAAPAQAALATALAAGVLRWKSRLDYALSRVSRRPLPRVDPLLLQILRIAAYEVGFARETPAPVAVDLAVRQARRLLGPGEASFANGVLRALVRLDEEEGRLPAPEGGPAGERLAVTFGHPAWLVRRWVGQFGEETTLAILKANNDPAPLSVRVQTLRASPQALGDLWGAHGIGWQPGILAPEALIADRPGAPVERLPGYQEGLFTPQSEASMLPGHAVKPQPGETVADLCAAPGGKSGHLAELSRDEARIVAVDLHPGRLPLVRQNARRLGLSSIRPVAADARRPALEGGRFDAVLLDAPCTALGTIARRPDVRWRRTPEDVRAMAELQAQLLEAAVDLLSPSGRLVYSVCSFEPEETVEQVRRLVQTKPVIAVPVRYFLPARTVNALQPEDKPWLTLLPHRVRTDGFFVVRLEFRRA